MANRIISVKIASASLARALKTCRISSERRTEIANLLARAPLPARDLPRGGRQPDVAVALHGGMLCSCPDHLHVRLPASPAKVLIYKLEAEADEMWSFVEKKANKQWIWLAMDATTRQIIAFHVGDRSRESAKALWGEIPEVYQEHATFHTDQYEVYNGVIPAERHKAITKQARKTNHIERFNNTLRQRLSRLVRATLSFSKKVENHIGAGIGNSKPLFP